MDRRSVDHITPLVDVMLVLLIIFMIAAPVLAHRATIDLPQGDSAPPPTARVDLAIAADGALTWNGAPMPRAALAPQLRLEAVRQPQADLHIAASANAAYDDVATVLAAARVAGIERIGFEEPD